MQVYSDWRAVPAEARGACVALGNFDGVHRGHRHLISSGHAARPDLQLAVLTFEPHPRELFRPDDPPFHLTLPAARARLLAENKVSLVYQLDFDAAFSGMAADDFIDQVLASSLGARHLICGPDYAFGHRRGGTAALLSRRAEELGIGVTIVAPLEDASGPISSSRIRRSLQDGYPERASELLGRPWLIEGEVASGDKRGRTIGFPTANIALGRHLEPARGVYAVVVELPDGSTFGGAANIGRRPTVSAGPESRLEVHLFDFTGDIYGETLDVAFIHWIRPELTFDGIDGLVRRMDEDCGLARAALARAPDAFPPV